MGVVPATSSWVIQLSSALMIVILSCCCLAVYGDEIDHFSWFKAPPHYKYNAPIYPPSPPYHKVDHHHKAIPPVQPPVYPPTKTPAVHPPKKAPAVLPPTKAPAVHPPKKAPEVHPPKKAPVVQPPVDAPIYYHPIHHPSKLVVVQGVVYCKSCKYPGVATLQGATPLFGAVVKLVCDNTKFPVGGFTDKNGYFFIIAPKSITSYDAHKCVVNLVSSPWPACKQPTNLNYGLDGAKLTPVPAKPHSPFDVFTVGPFAFEPHSKLPCKH